MSSLDARIRELRAKAHTLGQEVLHHPAACRVAGGCYLCEASKVERRRVAHVS